MILETIAQANRERYEKTMQTVSLEEIKQKAFAMEINSDFPFEKALEKILKNATHDFLKKARTVDGRQIVCDGFTLCALDQPVELSPEFVQDVNDGRADGIINRVLPAARENNGDALRVPDAATLRLHIKNSKAEKKTRKDKTPVIYDFGDGLPAVNAEYLANVIDIYGDAVQLVASSRGIYQPIYIKSDRGDGVLMPIRKV